MDFSISSIRLPISSTRPMILVDISSKRSCICFNMFCTNVFNSFVDWSSACFLSIDFYSNLQIISIQSMTMSGFKSNHNIIQTFAQMDDRFDQPKRSPMPTSSSSSFGASSFFAFLSSFLVYSFLVYLAASLAAGAGAPPAAGAEAADPPKLKKVERLCPWMALANILGQQDSHFTPAALTRVLILSAVMSCPSSCRIRAAQVHARWAISWGESLLTSTLDIK